MLNVVELVFEISLSLFLCALYVKPRAQFATTSVKVLLT